MVSQSFPNGITIHGFQTGTVAVKKAHYQYSGLGSLRMPIILASGKWIDPMPIWCWLIESSRGNILVDTGESTSFYDSSHLAGADAFVNRRILKIEIEKSQELAEQLKQINKHPDDIDAVILTHLHLDHVDGIQFFPKAEFLVSQLEMQRPFGVPFSAIPNWFKPIELYEEQVDFPFEWGFSLTDEITILATPGHTHGHQSVLVNTGNGYVLLAGDTTFNQDQLLKGKIGGINIDLKSSRQTLKNIKKLAREVDLIYLPSHDAESGRRLVEHQYLKLT